MLADQTDFEAKRGIIGSFAGHAAPVLRAFLTARTALLPLDTFHRKLPAHGGLLEVGCGHGIVAQYLARRSGGRRVLALDPDAARLGVAQAAGRGVANLEFRCDVLRARQHGPMAGAVIIGVLYLLDDASVSELLAETKGALGGDGVLLLSDIPQWTGGDWVLRFHILREQLSTASGFVKGQGTGMHFRSPERWRALLAEAGFHRIEPFAAPVFGHRTFDWLCR